MTRFEVKRNGESVGAFTPEELKDAAVAGSIEPDDEISPAGTDNWRKASSISGLNFPGKDIVLNENRANENSPSSFQFHIVALLISVAGYN